jgi:hypothetical protein
MSSEGKMTDFDIDHSEKVLESLKHGLKINFDMRQVEVWRLGVAGDSWGFDEFLADRSKMWNVMIPVVYDELVARINQHSLVAIARGKENSAE